MLAYYGVEMREDVLARELGATPEDGAPPEAIVRVAVAHGLSATKREHLTVDDLAAEIARGHPVIVELQAWSDAPRTSWTDDWDGSRPDDLRRIAWNRFVPGLEPSVDYRAQTSGLWMERTREGHHYIRSVGIFPEQAARRHR